MDKTEQIGEMRRIGEVGTVKFDKVGKTNR